MKKKILSLLAVASLVFFACSSDEAETADPQGVLYLLVKDANSNQPLAAASATLLSNGQTKITGTQGTVSFDGISGGTHLIRIEKEGYATVKDPYGIPSVGSSTREIPLYELSATLTGSLYYTDDEGARKPATGATVRVTFSDNYSFENKAIEAEVDVDGKYTLKMPAVPGGYTVEALETTIGGVKYGINSPICSYTCPDLTSGEGATKLNSQNYSKSSAVTFRLLESKIELADSTSEVVLHFTDSIDIANSDRITVYNSYNSYIGACYGTVLATEIAYSDDHKTVTIAPPQGSKWPTDPCVQVNNVTSGKGATLLSRSVTTIFKTEEVNLSNKFVKGLKITEEANPENGVTLQWDEVEGGDYYIIYAKANKGLDRYVQIGGYVYSSSMTITWSSYCNALFGTTGCTPLYDGNVMLVVQAINVASETQTLLKDVTPATVTLPTPPPVAGENMSLSVSTDYTEGITLTWNSLGISATKYILYVNGNKAREITSNSMVIAWGTVLNGVTFNRNNLAVGSITFTVKAVGRTETDMSNASPGQVWPVDISSESLDLKITKTWDNWFEAEFNEVQEASSYEIKVYDNVDADGTVVWSYNQCPSWDLGKNEGCGDHPSADPPYFNAGFNPSLYSFTPQSTPGSIQVKAIGFGASNVLTEVVNWP